MTEPNDYLWFLPDRLGRLFWLPLAPLGAIGMYYLYKLAAPATLTGRWIRVLLTMGFMGLVCAVIPNLNGLGPYSMYFIAIGSVLFVKQTYDHCLAAGKIIKPTSETMVERMADRVSEPKP